MSAKFPVCRDCYYHRRSPEVCDQCEDASEFEPADEMRQQAKFTRGVEKVVKLVTRDRVIGMQNPDLEITGILESYDPVLKRMSE